MATCTLTLDKKAIFSKWVYKLKPTIDSSNYRYKARLVASMVKWGTIRCVMALATLQGWKMFHLDVKIAFLNAPLTDEVYMIQPEGYIITGKEFQGAS